MIITRTVWTNFREKTYGEDESREDKRDDRRNGSAYESSDQIMLERSRRWEPQDQSGSIENANV